MTNIVIAVDGSKHARAALGWARELALSAREPTFHLVHSFTGPAVMSEGEALQYPRLLAEAENRAAAVLEEAAASLAGARVQTHLLQRGPAPAVLGVADRVGAAFIAVGSRGLSLPASLFLGSVSTEIVHQSPVPVLVARQKQPQPHAVRQVLVGVDGSPHSARALRFAADWLPGAAVTALHVLQLNWEAHQYFIEANMAMEEVLAKTTSDVMADTLAEAGLESGRVQARGAVGNAADGLLRAAGSGEYDLAVVGSRGRGTLAELFLGSVSERLLRLAPIPVVVVK